MSIFEMHQVSRAATIRGTEARNVDTADCGKPGGPWTLHRLRSGFPPHFNYITHIKESIHVPMRWFRFGIAEMTLDSCLNPA